MNRKGERMLKAKIGILGHRVSSLAPALCVAFIVFSGGCAFLTEGAKGVVGISTKSLEDSRGTAIKKVFDYDYFTTYTNTLDVLRKIETYVYTQGIKKKMIAVYVSRDDTTPVGVFFTDMGANKTQVEVSSPSTYAKEFIAGRLFPVLDKKVTLTEMEAQVREERKKQQAAQGITENK